MSNSKRLGVDLLVCQTCRRTDVENQDIRPGEQLLNLLKNASLSEKVTLIGVECLANCKNGCTIVLQAEEKWTYVYGNIHPESDFEQLCEGISGYVETDDGKVPWKQRVQLFKKNCVARIPPAANLTKTRVQKV